MDAVPTIDVSKFDSDRGSARERVASEISQALEEVGFFVIVGHGVQDDKVVSLVNEARTFFNQPTDVKERSKASSQSSTNRGYFPHEAETLAVASENGGKRLPDLKEAFVVGRDSVSATAAVLPGADTAYAPNIWPEGTNSFRRAMVEYYGELSNLTDRILKIFAYTLRLPDDYFVPHFEEHPSVLRVINYPARMVPPPKDQLRAAAHTDFGAITILKEGDSVGGLQVKTRKGEWIDIRSKPGSFVINIGNVMMRWTNEKWISNVHRVVNPQSESGWRNSRISIPYFVHPRPNATIECLPTCLPTGEQPKYIPIQASEFRMQQLSAAQTA